MAATALATLRPAAPFYKPRGDTMSSAISIGLSGLTVNQQLLDLAGQNVSNANTPGYTREVPTWRENTPIEINGIRYGTGVTQAGATSVRDRVLTARLDQQQQLASASGARLAASGFGFSHRGSWTSPMRANALKAPQAAQ